MKKIKQTVKKQSSPNFLTTYNGPEIAKQYIQDVLDGKIFACKWVKLFCERHVRDLTDGYKRGLHFDEKAGARILKL